LRLRSWRIRIRRRRRRRRTGCTSDKIIFHLGALTWQVGKNNTELMHAYVHEPSRWQPAQAFKTIEKR